jgi:hypothetical protein
MIAAAALGTAAYEDFGIRLVIDVAAVAIFALALYLRRHRRRDLFLSYTFFNVGLFVVLAVVTAHSLSAAVGFGIFGILSIVRLRSEPFTNLELSYLFIALVLGLVNGIGKIDRPFALLLNAVILLTVFLVDHPRLNAPMQFRTLTLDSVYADSAALRGDLERRLGVEIAELTITEIDYVREITCATIRCVERRRPAPADEHHDVVPILRAS